MKEFPEVELVTQAQRTQKNELTLKVNDNLFTEEWGLYIDKNWGSMFSGISFLKEIRKSFLLILIV